jgi:hypothetical protein
MGFLANLIPLIEYEGELNRFSKVFKNTQNPIINVFILYFIFFILPILGLYNISPQCYNSSKRRYITQ